MPPAAHAVVGQLTARRSRRSGATWGAVFGIYVAVQAFSYATSYPTVAARLGLVRSFGTNAGISALVGPARRIDTVGGFTAWKCLTVLAITGATWGLLTATRLMRGEEDAGRWELLLAGATTRRRAAAQALGGLAVGALCLFFVAAVVIVVAGRSSKVGFSTSAALFFAVAIAAGPCMFLSVGALMSQVGATRRQASAYAAAVLGASYAVRMVADSTVGLGWLRWATPLGWIEELQPLTRPNPAALVPISAFIVMLVVLTIVTAGRRDLGASVVADRQSAPARLGLLSTPTALTARMQRPVVLAWLAAIVAYGLLLGSIAKSGGTAITSSPTLRRALEHLGVSGPEAYVGLAMLIMAVALAVAACGQVGATRGEESGGRLENFLVRPVSRSAWLWGQLTFASAFLMTGGVLAGVSTWAGATASHAGIGLSTLVVAGLNVVPPALVLIGAGTLAMGVAPRSAVAVVYALLAWSFLVVLVGAVGHVSHWVLDSSVLHQMAPAPSEPVNWLADAAMVAGSGVLAALGVAAFSRRDVQGE